MTVPPCTRVRYLPEGVADDDRDWFAQHPGVDRRHRPATVAEMLELWIPLGRLPRSTVMVEVTQLAPGVRIRAPYCVVQEQPG